MWGPPLSLPGLCHHHPKFWALCSSISECFSLFCRTSIVRGSPAPFSLGFSCFLLLLSAGLPFFSILSIPTTCSLFSLPPRLSPAGGLHGVSPIGRFCSQSPCRSLALAPRGLVFHMGLMLMEDTWAAVRTTSGSVHANHLQAYPLPSGNQSPLWEDQPLEPDLPF